MNAQLPTKRDEGWKYSDLAAALGGAELSSAGEGSVIERLAAGKGALVEKLIPAGQSLVQIEHETSDEFTAAAEIVRVQEGARYQRVVFQSGAGVSLQSTRVVVEAGASFEQFIVALGGKLARLETHVIAAGEAAHIEMNGIYLCGVERHADLTSTVTHVAPAGRTQQLVKGVARRGGRGVFQGKIVVERAGQKTDARQYHKGMLLSDGAEIFAKPELMIHADDVACAHGNTAGGLDPSALFYLRSRGLPEAEARALLTEAFLVEAMPEWAPPEVVEEAQSLISNWLRSAP